MDRLPWWAPGMTKRDMQEEIAECAREENEDNGMEQFARWTAVESIQSHHIRSAIDTVYFASVDEGCIPAGRLDEHEYQRLMESWDANVPFVPSGKMETLRKHLRALKRLLYDHCETELTLDVILEVHRIMLEGDEHSCPGMLRSTPASANGCMYLNPEHVHSRLVSVLKEFNQHDGDCDPTDRAARLFYNIIHCIHPFVDGNGRIGRLLVSFVLMRSGFTRFAVPFNNGHSKPRKHFEKAVLHFSRIHEPTAMMNLYILECAHHYWCNFHMLKIK